MVVTHNHQTQILLKRVNTALNISMMMNFQLVRMVNVSMKAKDNKFKMNMMSKNYLLLRKKLSHF